MSTANPNINGESTRGTDVKDESFGQSIANGTQDLSALAGLFCTDAVERNLLAIQYGYFAVAASSMSILGILGVVKSFLKICIGLDRARNAGFNLDTVRPILGYGEGESSLAGELIDCNSITVDFSNPEEVSITATKQRYDSMTTPLLKVGSSWGSLGDVIAVNLGDAVFESNLRQRPWFIALVCIISPGLNAWLLLCVRSVGWSWIRIVAIPVFHMCLFLMTIFPIVYCWDNLAAGKHITANQWRSINERIPSIKRMRFLHAKAYNGDVIHFQSSRNILAWSWIRYIAFGIAVVTAVCYMAQYAILKQATDREAIIWVSCQAVLALLRTLLWTLDPDFDNIGGNRAEFVLVNNIASEELTAKEILCAISSCKYSNYPRDLPVLRNTIPRWAWDYLLSRPFKDILQEAAEVHTEGDEDGQKVPWKAEYCAFLDIDFDSILRRRLVGHQDKSEPVSWEQWRLCLWRDPTISDKIHPRVLVYVPVERITHRKGSSKTVIKSIDAVIEAVKVTNDPCVEFIVVPDSSPLSGCRSRKHVCASNGTCSPACEIGRETGLRLRGDVEGFLDSRSSVSKEAILTAVNDLETPWTLNTWGANVLMSATKDTLPDWDESQVNTARWTELQEGVDAIAQYIESRGQGVSRTQEA